MSDFLVKISLIVFIAAMADASAQTMIGTVVGAISYKFTSLIWEYCK